jgi:acetyl-CoA acetyltransferase
VKAALDDAGIPPQDVDGMATFTMDNNPEIEVNRYLGGGDLRFFSRTHFGGGAACAPILHAAMAVATGVCDVVVCYRAMNERSQQRFGIGVQDRPTAPRAEEVHFGWHSPFGLLTPASWVAMNARRYMHEYGRDHRGLRARVGRRPQARREQPAAWFYQKPITLEEHQRSRWIVDPLRLLDCCQESDGAVCGGGDEPRARARPAPAAGADRRGRAGRDDRSADDDPLLLEGDHRAAEMGLVAAQLYATAGSVRTTCRPRCSTTTSRRSCSPQLEEFGFCAAARRRTSCVRARSNLGGRLPINTHGGQLGEAYIHGMNGIAEGVRQVRGSSVNQVPNVEHVVVTAGTGVPTSGLILGAA